MNFFQKTKALMAAAVLIGGICGPATAQNFADKTIRIAFSFGPGDGADLLIRQLAPHIGALLPGRPAMVVENRPGAGGLVAANYLYNNASPDGLTMGFLVAPAHQSLTGDENAKFDSTKFQWLGAIPQSQVLLASKKLNIVKAKDFLSAPAELILALAGPSSVGSMTNRLFLDMIGARYRTVTGYSGQGETNLALARGEITLANTGMSVYLQTLDRVRKEGVYEAVLQRGELGPDGALHRSRLLPDVPTMMEALEEFKPGASLSPEGKVYKIFVSAMAVQFAIVMPPKVDPAIVQIFRSAVKSALENENTHASVRTALKTDYDFIDGPASEAIVKNLHEVYRAEPELARIATRLIEAR